MVIKENLKCWICFIQMCGLMSIKTHVDASYFATFLDGASRKVWMFVLKSKDQVFEVFKDFDAKVERQMENSLSVFTQTLVVSIPQRCLKNIASKMT